MSTQIHSYGKEYEQRAAHNDLTPVTSVTVGLYNDATDTLTETSDVGDITTEPTGTAYAKQSVALAGDVTFNLDASNDIEAEYADLTYDTSDSTQSVDSYFVVVNFAATTSTDDTGTDTDHIFFTGGLGDIVDLSSWNSFTAQNIKGILQEV